MPAFDSLPRAFHLVKVRFLAALSVPVIFLIVMFLDNSVDRAPLKRSGSSVSVKPALS